MCEAYDIADIADIYPSNTKIIKLNTILDAFVNLHKGIKQRDENWYKAMATTIGGSEVGALLGISTNEELHKYKSPYSNFNEVIKNKIAIMNGVDNWQNGGVACWWGTLFEEVITMIVEIELGGHIKGDSICIQIMEGHRNSPDGYIVAHFCPKGHPSNPDIKGHPSNPDIKGHPSNPDIKGHPSNNSNNNPESDLDDYNILYTTDMDPNLIKFSKIVMLEFKCPLIRKSSLEIPKHYIPQLWSGLAVSNVAAIGLFIDSIFRKCELGALGLNTDYDTIYHNKDQTLEIDLPICWGLIGLYSKIKAISFIDMGTLHYSEFNYMMGEINKKNIKTKICKPYFAQLRFNQKRLDSKKYIDYLMKKLEDNTPKGYYFIGILPWKLFYSSYNPISRRDCFLDEIKPLIDKVHKIVKESV
jgi:hypothetical protein